MKLQNTQKTENRLKVPLEKVHHKKYVKFPITNKTGKLKFKSKYHLINIFLPVIKNLKYCNLETLFCNEIKYTYIF